MGGRLYITNQSFCEVLQENVMFASFDIYPLVCCGYLAPLSSDYYIFVAFGWVPFFFRPNI